MIFLVVLLFFIFNRWYLLESRWMLDLSAFIIYIHEDGENSLQFADVYRGYRLYQLISYQCHLIGTQFTPIFSYDHILHHFEGLFLWVLRCGSGNDGWGGVGVAMCRNSLCGQVRWSPHEILSKQHTPKINDAGQAQSHSRGNSRSNTIIILFDAHCSWLGHTYTFEPQHK